jgi:hypothetical protein
LQYSQCSFPVLNFEKHTQNLKTLTKVHKTSQKPFFKFFFKSRALQQQMVAHSSRATPSTLNPQYCCFKFEETTSESAATQAHKGISLHFPFKAF